MARLLHRDHDDERKPARRTGPTPFETTDVEDQEALAAAILELIQTAPYDDMTWAEIDNALRLVSHNVKINWSDSGTVEPATAGAVDGVMRRRAA